MSLSHAHSNRIWVCLGGSDLVDVGGWSLFVEVGTRGPYDPELMLGFGSPLI